jgi:small GTP-binding protein
MSARTFKIVVVGEGAVGKTSLVKRFVDRIFTRDMKSTIGLDFSSKVLKVDGVEKILQIWDLGGQPHFKSIADMFFKGASGIVAVFDVSRRESLLNLVEWINHVHSVIGRKPMVIVGNKVDLRRAGSRGMVYVSKEDGTSFADRYESPYVETSAKESISVDEAFKSLLHRLGA